MRNLELLVHGLQGVSFAHDVYTCICTCTCDAGGFKMASCQILTASCYGVRAVHSVQQENGVL